MFVFMVNEKNPIEDGRGDRLSRGFFCWKYVVTLEMPQRALHMDKGLRPLSDSLRLTISVRAR